jgi:ADP-ribose pyrophosphatase YjhB (NUDIX family)
MTIVMQLVYRVQKRAWKLLRPRTRGVKVMVFNDAGEILLVRNSYGATGLHVLPGRGVRPWEQPAAAAEREIREELGCIPDGLKAVTTHLTSAEGKRDIVYLFEAKLGGLPRPDGIEVIEASFFQVDALPETISPATARRLAERRGAVEPDGMW